MFLAVLLRQFQSTPLTIETDSLRVIHLYIIAILVTLTHQTFAQAEDGPWKDRRWLRLMHYQPSLLHGYDSEIDDPKFFLSPEGKHNPEAELTATLKAFQDPTHLYNSEEESVYCRFPARAVLLKELFPSFQPQTRSCPKFEQAFNKVYGPRASYVFSSFYLNNPSSAFGHTFIRIHKAESGQSSDLLDYGVNYAANPDSSNPISYAFKGLTGQFKGVFTALQYYYKVREYNDAESRDLWEYELNLRPEQIRYMLFHLWELGNAYIDYWYLTENCSYHMLALIEVADPKVEILNRFRTEIIPSETVKIVAEVPSLVKAVNYRPSRRTIFEYRLEHLLGSERKMIPQLVEGDFSEYQRLPSSYKVRVVDTAIDYLDSRFAKDIFYNKEAAHKKKRLIEERQLLHVKSVDPTIVPDELNSPEKGHKSRRFMLGPDFRSKSPTRITFDYRFSLHDQLDPKIGFPPYAEIMMFGLRLATEPQEKKLYLDKASLFKIVSISDFSTLQPDVSWQMELSGERLNFWGAPKEPGVFFQGGAGFSKYLFPHFTSSVFLKAQGTAFIQKMGPVPQYLPSAGSSLRFTYFIKDLQLLADIWWKYDFYSKIQHQRLIELGAQYNIHKNLGFRLTGLDYDYEKALQLNLAYYH